jgi:hypothetical protein
MRRAIREAVNAPAVNPRWWIVTVTAKTHGCLESRSVFGDGLDAQGCAEAMKRSWRKRCSETVAGLKPKGILVTWCEHVM